MEAATVQENPATAASLSNGSQEKASHPEK
jgi:hypothetical protein